jgi:hypothetical protein
VCILGRLARSMAPGRKPSHLLSRMGTLDFCALLNGAVAEQKDDLLCRRPVLSRSNCILCTFPVCIMCKFPGAMVSLLALANVCAEEAQLLKSCISRLCLAFSRQQHAQCKVESAKCACAEQSGCESSELSRANTAQTSPEIKSATW